MGWAAVTFGPTRAQIDPNENFAIRHRPSSGTSSARLRGSMRLDTSGAAYVGALFSPLDEVGVRGKTLQIDGGEVGAPRLQQGQDRYHTRTGGEGRPQRTNNWVNASTSSSCAPEGNTVNWCRKSSTQARSGTSVPCGRGFGR